MKRSEVLELLANIVEMQNKNTSDSYYQNAAYILDALERLGMKPTPHFAQKIVENIEEPVYVTGWEPENE